MSYTTGIPSPGQSLGNSRPQVQGNFDYISTSFAVNHVAFNLAGVGKHKFLQMPEQGSAPVTAINEGGLYTKESGGITNLFWRLENNGAEVQMTNIAPLPGNNGYSFLPGGMLIQWAQTGTVNSGDLITFPIAFPNALNNIQVTQFNAGSPAGQRAVSVIFIGSLSQFRIRITTLGSSPSDSSATINFIAIGR